MEPLLTHYVIVHQKSPLLISSDTRDPTQKNDILPDRIYKILPVKFSIYLLHARIGAGIERGMVNVASGCAVLYVSTSGTKDVR